MNKINVIKFVMKTEFKDIFIKMKYRDSKIRYRTFNLLNNTINMNLKIISQIKTITCIKKQMKENIKV